MGSITWFCATVLVWPGRFSYFPSCSRRWLPPGRPHRPSGHSHSCSSTGMFSYSRATVTGTRPSRKRGTPTSFPVKLVCIVAEFLCTCFWTTARRKKNGTYRKFHENRHPQLATPQIFTPTVRKSFETFWSNQRGKSWLKVRIFCREAVDHLPGR